jgi:fumarate hydratase class II
MVFTSKFRLESDSMGSVEIPEWAFWGAQTQRALDNFQISNHKIPCSMIHAIAIIKCYAAKTNNEIGVLAPDLARAIMIAAREIYEGKLKDHFPLDVFQTGSATSTNMNVNEVIANRANQILGSMIGTRHPVHPNDHVNYGQSSNDVIPAALQISCRLACEPLLIAISQLHDSITFKANEFANIVKLGRTHLQDAVPMTLGQELHTWASQLQKCKKRLSSCFGELEELPLGGTAIGTGLNCHPDFAVRLCTAIAEHCNIPFVSAPNKFEHIAARDAQVNLMGVLNTLAVVLMKIGNDIRLLASGPRGGLGELILPSLQPGSSIMPGKVNPVIPEMLIQVAAHVHGKMTSVTIAGQN